MVKWPSNYINSPTFKSTSTFGLGSIECSDQKNMIKQKVNIDKENQWNDLNKSIMD